MQTIAEKLIEQGKQEGLQEGELKGKMKSVYKALENNIPIEMISLFSGLSLEEIRQYKALMKMKPATMN